MSTLSFATELRCILSSVVQVFLVELVVSSVHNRKYVIYCADISAVLLSTSADAESLLLAENIAENFRSKNRHIQHFYQRLARRPFWLSGRLSPKPLSAAVTNRLNDPNPSYSGNGLSRLARRISHFLDSNQGSYVVDLGLPTTTAMAFHSNMIQPAGHAPYVIRIAYETKNGPLVATAQDPPFPLDSGRFRCYDTAPRSLHECMPPSWRLGIWDNYAPRNYLLLANTLYGVSLCFCEIGMRPSLPDRTLSLRRRYHSRTGTLTAVILSATGAKLPGCPQQSVSVIIPQASPGMPDKVADGRGGSLINICVRLLVSPRAPPGLDDGGIHDLPRRRRCKIVRLLVPPRLCFPFSAVKGWKGLVRRAKASEKLQITMNRIYLRKQNTPNTRMEQSFEDITRAVDIHFEFSSIFVKG
ncbi:hypothetical protein PR048_007148 [Dryococelus australis]|uniref:Uncharacterized protein n=1 Tax=Dryococelus australis TaxID=614101 RepID=A0ABQ9ICW2_9NEOP|nr:hypothetical protein PR048_007148 [Dryococelus australis]